MKSQKTNNQNKLLALLGFARKAGKLVSGDETCELQLRRKKCKLILIAADAADNTKGKWERMAETAGVPCYMVLSKEVISQAIGQANRSVIAISDKGFAKQMILLIQQAASEQEGEEPGGETIE